MRISKRRIVVSAAVLVLAASAAPGDAEAYDGCCAGSEQDGTYVAPKPMPLPSEAEIEKAFQGMTQEAWDEALNS